MPLTPEEREELEFAERVFEDAGGRGVELAERIDDLRKKDAAPATYYATTFSVTVLSEEPIPEDMALDEALAEADTGEYVAGDEGRTVVELTAQQVASALTEAGSEPGFFGLDTEGNEVDT